jgi:hypothetical protein
MRLIEQPVELLTPPAEADIEIGAESRGDAVELLGTGS